MVIGKKSVCLRDIALHSPDVYRIFLAVIDRTIVHGIHIHVFLPSLFLLVSLYGVGTGGISGRAPSKLSDLSKYISKQKFIKQSNFSYLYGKYKIMLKFSCRYLWKGVMHTFLILFIFICYVHLIIPVYCYRGI